MATNMDTGEDSSTGINDLLTCPVCYEAYKEPKTLSCLHTFCARCLVRCMSGYRRELPCPTCRRITMIPASGVQGLQYDYRIEQMKDMLKTVAVKKEETSRLNNSEQKYCDFCLSLDQKVASQFHCIQCYICFCSSCIAKHNENIMFKDHQVIDITLQESADSIFCKQHKQHPVRYCCEVCSTTLCTICTMNHDSKHTLSPLDHVMNRYKKGLQEMTATLTTKLTEIKNVLSSADAYKKSTESTYLSLQTVIQEQADAAIKKVREQQSKLHGELKTKMELKVMQCDSDVLKTARLKQDNITSLRQQITTMMERGHPLQFLASYKEMKAKVDEISGLQLPSLESFTQTSVLNLIPNDKPLDGILGKLQECIIISDTSSEINPLSPRPLNPDSPLINPGSPVINPGSPGSPFINPGSPCGSDASTCTFTRCCSSPSESFGSPLPSPSGSSTSDTNGSGLSDNLSGLGRPSSAGLSSHLFNTASSPGSMEPMVSDPVHSSILTQPSASLTSTLPSVSHSSSQPIIAAARFNPVASGSASSHQRSISSRKRLILNAHHRVDKRKVDNTVPLRSSSEGSPPKRVASPVLSEMLENPQLLFRVDGVGGWPGKVMIPCSAAFLSSGHVIVAEKENRLQIFDLSGHSKSVFGWGHVRPLAVSMTPNGQILVTDGKDKCVKVFTADGQVTSKWGQGLIDPTDLTAFGPDQVVVVDSSTRTVHIYQIDGKRVGEFPVSVGMFEPFQSLGCLHVAVDQRQRIIVSDSGQHCIKIFDNKGTFLSKFGTHGSKSGQLRKPHGICVDKQGNIIVADHNNRRVSLFTGEGQFLRNILTPTDGMKCPFGVAIDNHGHLVVTETHQDSTVMKNSYHTVSLYQLYE